MTRSRRRSISSPASTPSTATSPATAARGCRARHRHVSDSVRPTAAVRGSVARRARTTGRRVRARLEAGGERADALAARPELERRVRAERSRPRPVGRAHVRTVGCSTCVPRNTDGNVRRKSTPRRPGRRRTRRAGRRARSAVGRDHHPARVGPRVADRDEPRVGLDHVVVDRDAEAAAGGRRRGCAGPRARRAGVPLVHCTSFAQRFASASKPGVGDGGEPGLRAVGGVGPTEVGGDDPAVLEQRDRGGEVVAGGCSRWRAKSLPGARSARSRARRRSRRRRPRARTRCRRPPHATTPPPRANASPATAWRRSSASADDVRPPTSRPASAQRVGDAGAVGRPPTSAPGRGVDHGGPGIGRRSHRRERSGCVRVGIACGRDR